MKAFIKLTLVILVTVVATATAAGAAKRVALVIGNSAYRHAGELANPRNDATDIAAALRKADFQVLDALDVDKAAFDRKIRDFASALSDAEAGVLFYAGHGLQVAGKNYLVPIDAELTTADALEFEMVQLDTIHRIMERQSTTNILFIDACRNNPLARNLSRAMGTRSTEIGRGLAPVESGVGSLISFSTQPGNVALDGSGRNSPYAAALIRRISTSNDDLSALLIDVRNDVRRDTANKQIPWEHSALTGRFHFNGQKIPAAPSAPTAPAGSEAAQVWSTIKDSPNRSILEAFIKQFGATVYAAMAQARLDELRHQEASNAPTIKPPGSQPQSASPAPPSSSERKLRLASSFPKAMTEVFEPAERFVAQVQSLSAGRLKIELFAAGEIVPGLQVLDAVGANTIAMGWTVAQYYFAKNPAFAAIGGGVPLGINAAQFVRWLEGEGKRVRADLYAETLPVMALACSINGPKGLWLRKEVRRLEDLKGLRLRVGGTSALSLQSTGIVSQQLSAAEIYPALEKGTIDGLEWFTPPMDEKLGWHKVAKYYYYPFGDPTFSTVSDLLINRRVWDELDPSSRNLLESACQQQLRSDSSKLADGVSASLARFKAGGTAVASVPDTIIATHRQGAEAYLDQNVRSSAGLAAWRSLKAAR